MHLKLILIINYISDLKIKSSLLWIFTKKTTGLISFIQAQLSLSAKKAS